MADVTVRSAIPADVEAIAALWIETDDDFRGLMPPGFGAPMQGEGEPGWQARWLDKELASPQYVVLVASRQGAIEGYVLGEVKDTDDDHFPAPYLSISQLAVTRTARRSGVGKTLMEAVERLARERSMHAIDLEVSPANSAAVRLYEGLRYTVLSRRMAKLLD